MWSEQSPRWLLFAGDVLITAHEINREYQMAVEVKGLAETVRRAKSALGSASLAAGKLEDASVSVYKRVKQVEAMTSELVAAEQELGNVVDALSNGGPPLEEPSSSSQLTLDQAASVVNEANK